MPSPLHQPWLPLLLIVHLATAPAALAQFRRALVVPDQALAGDGVLLPDNREMRRQLDRARQALEAENYGDAGVLLDNLLQQPEDSFFQPDDTKPIYISLKAEAQRLIGSMPDAGRNLYELQFGARAQQLLDQAVAEGNVASIAEVARRSFHTSAGREAKLLLARHHLDHDRPMAAATCLARLVEAPGSVEQFGPALEVMLASCWLQADMPQRAQQVLEALKARAPQSKVRLGGREIALFSGNAQALQWLATHTGDAKRAAPGESLHWTIYRGNATRNAASSGGSPLLNARWRVPVDNTRELLEALATMRQGYLDREVPVLPAAHPLAVADVVLMRTPSNLLAVDFRNGKRIWEVRSADDSLGAGAMTGWGATTAWRGGPLQPNPTLGQRIWDDATLGTMASDGQYVFLIDDGDSPGRIAGVSARPRQIVLAAGQQLVPEAARSTNKLSARELSTEGKLKWEVGGVSGEQEPELAGAYFLGPPLPLSGSLYTLVELRGQIRLVVLNAHTGRQEWFQPLANVEQNVAQDPLRRLAGVSPSFADGVLVCPTAAGAMVAVDLTDRSLLWGYQYPRNQQWVNQMAVMGMGGFFPVPGGGLVSMMSSSPNGRWADSVATIAEGHVLLTPIESDELHCVSLLDGSLAWKQPRNENLYLGCVDRGQLLVVGRRQLHLLRLADGKAIWRRPLDLPGSSMPSGRGFLSDGHYYLPLSTAEVAKVDLAAGRIVSRVRSRKGHIPGNLICYRGEVISQSADYLEAFYQLEPLKQEIERRITERSDDPWALARRGEIALEEGRLEQALADLRMAFPGSDDDPFTRELFVETLTAALTSDFAAHRGVVDELASLIRLESERAAFLRALAEGLQSHGERVEALRTYLELADLEYGRDDLESVGATLSVRRDRWVQARVDGLWRDADALQRRELLELLSPRIDSALEANQPRALRTLLSYLGDHPRVDEIRGRLVGQLAGSETLLEREQLLLALEESADRSVSRHAVARLAELMREADRPEQAAVYYRRLRDEFADEPCLGDQTGTQLVAEIPEGSPIRRALAPSHRWPLGEVQATVGRRGAGVVNYQQLAPVAMRRRSGPLLQGVSIRFDQSNQTLAGRNGLGQEVFRIPLSEGAQNRSGNPFNASINHGDARGHLLVVSMGWQVLCFDALRSTPGGRILWQEDLMEQGLNPFGYGMNIRQINVPFGAPRMVATNAQNQAIGVMGPVTRAGVCVQRGRDLRCLDPLTGEALWVRHNVAPGGDVFGDDEITVVASAESGEALVLRAIDGQLLATRKVAAPDKRWGAIGRRLIEWQTTSRGRIELRLWDPWTEKAEVLGDYAPGSKGTVLPGDVVAVLEPGGKFELITLADGRKRVEAQLEPEPALQGIYLLESPDQWLLVAHRPAHNPRSEISVHSPLGELHAPIVSGRVYAFSRHTGQSLWPTPALIDQHALLLHQPSELPVLCFVRQVQRRERRSGTVNGSMLCLDKRTGRALYENDGLPTAISGCEIAGDPEQNRVVVRMPGQTVTLEFTEQPVPPEPPHQAGLDPPRTTLERSAVGSVLRAFGRAAEEIGGGAIEMQIQPPGDPFE